MNALYPHYCNREMNLKGVLGTGKVGFPMTLIKTIFKMIIVIGVCLILIKVFKFYYCIILHHFTMKLC